MTNKYYAGKIPFTVCLLLLSAARAFNTYAPTGGGGGVGGGGGGVTNRSPRPVDIVSLFSFYIRLLAIEIIRHGPANNSPGSHTLPRRHLWARRAR